MKLLVHRYHRFEDQKLMVHVQFFLCFELLFLPSFHYYRYQIYLDFLNISLFAVSNILFFLISSHICCKLLAGQCDDHWSMVLLMFHFCRVLDGLCNWNLLRLHWIEYFRDLPYFVLMVKLSFLYRNACARKFDLSERMILHFRFFLQ